MPFSQKEWEEEEEQIEQKAIWAERRGNGSLNSVAIILFLSPKPVVRLENVYYAFFGRKEFKIVNN